MLIELKNLFDFLTFGTDQDGLVVNGWRPYISWKCSSPNKTSWHFECNKKHAKWLIQSNKWHKKREWQGISSLQNNFLLSKNNSSLFGMSNNDLRWYLFHSKSRLNLLSMKKIRVCNWVNKSSLFSSALWKLSFALQISHLLTRSLKI